jgi:hypothetical protein
MKEELAKTTPVNLTLGEKLQAIVALNQSMKAKKESVKVFENGYGYEDIIAGIREEISSIESAVEKLREIL